MRKTKEEAQSEVQKLKALKGNIPHYSEYKDNYWDFLQAQYMTLRYDLEMVDIKKQWPDENDAQGAAEDALYWKETGKIPSPSENWQNLLDAMKIPL